MVKTDYYCPFCATQDMWQEENDSGDFYLGVTTHCDSCKSETHCLGEQNGSHE